MILFTFSVIFAQIKIFSIKILIQNMLQTYSTYSTYATNYVFLKDERRQKIQNSVSGLIGKFTLIKLKFDLRFVFF